MENNMETKKDRNILAITLLIYSILVIVANTLLAIFFKFPDILRESSIVRFELFIQNSAIIIPTYYIFLISAFLQIFIPIIAYHFINKRDSLSSITLCAGILAGVLQSLGFVRWIVLIPFLANQQTDMALLEGFANSYLGMSVGEHLGSLFMGLWIILISYQMLKSKLFDQTLSYIALASGLGILLSSFEAIGISSLSIISLPAWGLFVIWSLLTTYNLFKTENFAPKIKWYAWIIAIIFYLINILPAFI